MNRFIAPFMILTLASFAGAASVADAAQPAYPAHTIPHSQLRELPRTPAGRHYQLHVGLPESYATNPDRRYPVVFVTDGYWDFAKMTAIHGSLVYDQVVPEFITVGLGYVGDGLDYGSLRLWELAPVPFGADAKASGHAAEFLRTLETEIIPFIEREYRVDPAHRVLAGASLGGLFTLYTMYTKTDLFSAYIAATPAVVVGDDWLLGYEEAFVKAGKTLKTRLYVSGGGNESPGFLGGILRFNARITSRKHAGLAYEFRIIDGERHAGMQFETYVRGLRFVFAPIAPQTGPATAP